MKYIARFPSLLLPLLIFTAPTSCMSQRNYSINDSILYPLQFNAFTCGEFNPDDARNEFILINMGSKELPLVNHTFILINKHDTLTFPITNDVLKVGDIYVEYNSRISNYICQNYKSALTIYMFDGSGNVRWKYKYRWPRSW